VIATLSHNVIHLRDLNVGRDRSFLTVGSVLNLVICNTVFPDNSERMFVAAAEIGKDVDLTPAMDLARATVNAQWNMVPNAIFGDHFGMTSINIPNNPPILRGSCWFHEMIGIFKHVFVDLRNISHNQHQQLINEGNSTGIYMTILQQRTAAAPTPTVEDVNRAFGVIASLTRLTLQTEDNFKIIEAPLNTRRFSAIRDFVNSPQGLLFFNHNAASQQSINQLMRIDLLLRLLIALENIFHLLQQRTTPPVTAQLRAQRTILNRYQGCVQITRLSQVLTTTLALQAAAGNVTFSPHMNGTFVHYSLKNALEARYKCVGLTTANMTRVIGHLARHGSNVNGTSRVKMQLLRFSPAPAAFSNAIFRKAPIAPIVVAPPFPAFTAQQRSLYAAFEGMMNQNLLLGGVRADIDAAWAIVMSIYRHIGINSNNNQLINQGYAGPLVQQHSIIIDEILSLLN
jgi:hypothetical protein